MLKAAHWCAHRIMLKSILNKFSLLNLKNKFPSQFLIPGEESKDDVPFEIYFSLSLF
jgi:hypothetical protein